ncbi:MAG: chitobiase/beta-hexosaminidase C-terminal domain-containing protein, partial [Lachnospira sp.]|nr:chitobiase/beta-hexosaminidase C-terminal domain-containing protein [Lachnospira sp.]
MPDEKRPEGATRDLTRVIPVFRDNEKAPDTPDNQKEKKQPDDAGTVSGAYVPIDKGSDTQMLSDNTGFAEWSDERQFRENTKSFTIPEAKTGAQKGVRDVSVEIPDIDETTGLEERADNQALSGKEDSTSESESDLDREMEASIRQMMQEEEFKAKGAAQARGERVGGPVLRGTGEEGQIPAVQGMPDRHGEAARKIKKQQKKKFTVGKAAALIAAALAILAAAVYFAVWNGTSYEMQLKKGKELYEEENYQEALPYLTHAAATAEGKSNVELLYMLADTQYQTDDQEKAIDTLTKLLGQQEDYSRGIELLARIYSDDKNGTALNELIAAYKGKEAEAYLVPYEVDRPVADYASGNYNNPITLTLKTEDSCWIYYTTDGSEPDKDSKVYTDPISLGKGDTQIKAVAMNGIGVVSEVLDLNYSITYLAPEAPAVTPD